MQGDHPDGRRHPVHQPIVDPVNGSIIVFVTVCSKQKKPILAEATKVEVVIESWLAAKSWLIGHYVIMPDHIHFFCAPGTFPALPLKQWIRYWKNLASRNWPHASEQPIWHRDFWDTQLRQGENYTSKWECVFQNPVRAGLVKKAEDWAFQGEINSLSW
jgi:REP element-mobilizing transposase RayT